MLINPVNISGNHVILRISFLSQNAYFLDDCVPDCSQEHDFPWSMWARDLEQGVRTVSDSKPLPVMDPAGIHARSRALE